MFCDHRKKPNGIIPGIPVSIWKFLFLATKRRLYLKPCQSQVKKKAPFRFLASIRPQKQKAPFQAPFFDFSQNCIFSKNKGAFSLNKAPASTLYAKGAFFWKSMDFQLSLEKKIKSVAILVNFLERFEVAHKMKFSSSFFENLKIRQNIIFSLCFDGVIVSQK